MNLLEIRQAFRTLSGRYDLVSAAGADTGFDTHLHAGQKYLDRLMSHEKSVGTVFRKLVVGQYSVTFEYSRALKEIWCATGSDGRWQLTKLTMQDFRTAYADRIGSVDQGAPLHWTPAALRTVPDLDRIAPGDSFDAIGGFADVLPNNYEYNGVLIAPGPSEITQIEVIGYFYTMRLLEDEHVNYWSANHDTTLIMAAMRNIEIFNRNTQGVADWTAAIRSELITIDADVVEEELPNVMQFEG